MCRRFAILMPLLGSCLGIWLAACAATEQDSYHCNGRRELCDRPYNEVSFATAHNAMNNAEDEWLFPNQDHGISRQLKDGIRAMMLDTYYWQGSTALCHVSCEFGVLSMAEGLGEIRDFLLANPYEIVSLLIEDHILNDATEEAFGAAGLENFLYIHDPAAAWPTLGEMIHAGTRLVVGTEFSRPPPAWYHHLWDLAWDTPYSFKSAAEFSCRHNRGSTDNELFLVNHWLSDEVGLPSREGASMVNQYQILGPRVRQCREEAGQQVNFVALDFVSLGDLIPVVDELNGFE